MLKYWPVCCMCDLKHCSPVLCRSAQTDAVIPGPVISPEELSATKESAARIAR